MLQNMLRQIQKKILPTQWSAWIAVRYKTDMISKDDLDKI